MGHVTFAVVHIVGLALYPPSVLVTALLHLLYGRRLRKRPTAQHPDTRGFQRPPWYWLLPTESSPRQDTWVHVHCHYCRWLIRADSTTCAQCGADLELAKDAQPADRPTLGPATIA